jgi:benzoyl-CoA reductase/2-hydroxyglutaryl-CoA dehydratase subunit BcrC/BadD/HgdB
VGTFLPLAPPTEIIEAAGAVPFRLLATGGADADLRGMSRLGRDACSLCRGVLGQAMVVPPPVTAVAAGSACDRLRRAAGAWPEATGLPLFSLALPRTREDSATRDETAAELELLAREISARTGVAATRERLAEAIRRGNRVRAILRIVDAARRDPAPKLGGSAFLDVVRAAHALDSATFLALAGTLPAEIGALEAGAPPAARILLVGPTLPDGRRDVVEIAERRAVVAGDLTDSGSLGFGGPVDETREPFGALADQLLAHPILAAPLRPAAALRAAFTAAIAAVRPDGVLYRGVPFCRPWNSEAVNLRGLSPVPFLDVRVDGPGATGQLRTRIEAFVETLAARRATGKSG